MLKNILAIIAVALPIILWFKTYKIYRDYYFEKNKLKEPIDDNVFGGPGGFIGVKFYMRPPVRIKESSQNSNIRAMVKKYNKYVKIFWLWTIFGTTLIILYLHLSKNSN